MAELQPTDEIMYEPFRLELDNASNEKIIFEYDRPYLVDINEPSALSITGEISRKTFDWGTEETGDKGNKEKRAKPSFAMS